MLEGLGRPLMCTSVHVDKHVTEETEVPDLGSMLEGYGAGIDFIIDVGTRLATFSTVRTGPVPGSLRFVRVQWRVGRWGGLPVLGLDWPPRGHAFVFCVAA